MDDVSLNDLGKVWIKHLANTGSTPDAQCSKDTVRKICQVLSTAFSPSDKLDVIPSGKNKSNGFTENDDSTKDRATANTIMLLDSPSTNNHLLAQPQSASSVQAKPEHTFPKNVVEEENIEMVDCDINKGGDLKMENGDAGIQDAEIPDVDGQSISSAQSKRDKIDKRRIATIEPTDNIVSISKNTSGIDSATQPITNLDKLSHPGAFKIVLPPCSSYATHLKSAYTPVRALYLDLFYQDRFVLLNLPAFLLFLAEQPRVSHAFLSYLINHPFGIRYVHRDGSNANHGITPFGYPFPPVDLSIPMSLYFENRWALLNDPAWLWHARMEEFLMASFWAEMSFRGGLGVMQRRREVTERASKFAMAPF